MLVSYALDKGLLPRTLELVLSKLGIKSPMCLSIEFRICRSSISLSLICIIKSALCQFRTQSSLRREHLLEASIRVRGSSRADDVGRCGFTHTKI